MTDRETLIKGAEIEALHKHKDDPDEWDDEPAEIKVRPSPTEVVSFRIPGHELDLLQEATAAEGVTCLSSFVTHWRTGSGSERQRWCPGSL